MSEEYERALKLANWVLDQEFDPDADICILARQFLRARERVEELEKPRVDSDNQSGGKGGEVP